MDEYVDTLEQPNEKFTSIEIEELKKKLNNLEIKFDDLLQKNVINENELRVLKQQLNGAEQDLSAFTKKIWYKTSMRNVIGKTKSILTSKEGREVALGLVKKLIGLE
ncbi:Chromate resistance protein ChrB [Sulfurimonas sp.]|uniref:Chromate resistance protein ChrB n=1 Tax=Sulfurimonas sp. TaxID=2022749 RepID=UPI0039E30635